MNENHNPSSQAGMDVTENDDKTSDIDEMDTAISGEADEKALESAATEHPL